MMILADRVISDDQIPREELAARSPMVVLTSRRGNRQARADDEPARGFRELLGRHRRRAGRRADEGVPAVVSTPV